MNWKEHISSDPEIMFGKMLIKGTRIPVELILEKLAAGNTVEDLIKAYQRITTADVQACLLFAADNTKHEENTRSSVMDYQVIADESVDFRIVIQLRNSGITVYSIAEEIPSITDKSVLLFAFEKNALLITEDKDFGELVFRLQLPHHGILLVRIQEADYKIFSVVAAIKEHYDEMINKFSVINNNKLRIKE